MRGKLQTSENDLVAVAVNRSQWCLFLPPPLSNKIFYFYIVFDGFAMGVRGP